MRFKDLLHKRQMTRIAAGPAAPNPDIHEQSPERALYEKLIQPVYNDYSSGFETVDKGDGMSLVLESISGWWKPRFLLDHRARAAYEFLKQNERFARFNAEDDVDWDSLEDVGFEPKLRAISGDASFPTHVWQFENGTANVSWQINPDGMYYMDDDGYGMTNDQKIELSGAVDRTGKVVKKYTLSE